MSFYLPNFEVANFLGKANEDIAKTLVKWGPPGHNKWGVKTSLDKWKPAVVPFPGDIAQLSASELNANLNQKLDWEFWNDYALGSKRNGYIFCKPYESFQFEIM